MTRSLVTVISSFAVSLSWSFDLARVFLSKIFFAVSAVHHFSSHHNMLKRLRIFGFSFQSYSAKIGVSSPFGPPGCRVSIVLL